jgi:hypothetical protein
MMVDEQEPQPPDDIPEFDPAEDDTEPMEGLDFTGVEETAPQPVPERDPLKPEGVAPLGFEPEGGGEPVPKIPDAPPPAPPDLEEFDQAVNVQDGDEIGFQTLPESTMWTPEEPQTWKPRQKWASRQEKSQAQHTARHQRMGLEGPDYDEDAPEGPEPPQEAAFAEGSQQGPQAQQGQEGGVGELAGVLQEILQAIGETNEKLDEVVDKLDDVGTFEA